MKLPEFKGILKAVGAITRMSDKDASGTKQTVLIEIPERKISDEWGNERTIRAEHYEMDVINNKIPDGTLSALVGKKVIVSQSYLNGYLYADKETGEKRYGKSMTLIQIKEFKG